LALVKVMKTLQIIITGKVQGVFFRDFAKKCIGEIGAKGWIRNRQNGSVEIQTQGSEKQFDQILQKCYEGSPDSIVESLQKKFIETEEIFEDFIIR